MVGVGFRELGFSVASSAGGFLGFRECCLYREKRLLGGLGLSVVLGTLEKGILFLSGLFLGLFGWSLFLFCIGLASCSVPCAGLTVLVQVRLPLPSLYIQDILL